MNDQIIPNNSDTAVLFIHGIQGGPRQFEFLTEKLPEGTDYVNMVLPGHGATVKEFKKATKEDWLGAVRSEALRLKEKHRNVICVAHSMGCLLGLIIQHECAPFSAMILLCAPFHIRPTKRYLASGVAAVNRASRLRKDPFIDASMKSVNVYFPTAASYLGVTGPYMGLFALMRAARGLEPDTRCPAEFFFSEMDEIVSPRSRKNAHRFAGARVRMLPGSSHNYFAPEARKRVAKTLARYL